MEYEHEECSILVGMPRTWLVTGGVFAFMCYGTTRVTAGGSSYTK